MGKASPALIEANRRICQEQRRKSLEQYYADPKRCKTCGTIIIVGAKQNVATTKRATFCTKSCAAQYNNQRYPKRKSQKSGPCELCGIEIEYSSRSRYKGRKSGYIKIRFCDECRPKARVETLRKRQQEMGNNVLPKPLPQMTKRELRDHYQWHLTYKSQIGKHAKKVFADNGGEKICCHCGFIHGVQVCHIRDIKDFPDSTLISEINALSNLIPLCPNCHWLFDHHLIDPTKTSHPIKGILEEFRDQSIVNRLLSLIDSKPSSSSSARPERRVSTAEANS